MIIRNNEQVKRNKSRKQLFFIVLSFLVIFSSFILPGNSDAEVISRGAYLKEVGPINDFNGFPVWYKDSNDVKLQLCLDPNDTLCGLVTEDFDPTKPITFPTNYPGEAFYQLAEAEMRVGGNRARAVFALEATFNLEVPEENQQTVFGRVRFRFDGLRSNAQYTITHPYGQDKIVADADGEINYTEDIGAGQIFSGVLNSRIGTFLKWDPAVAPQAPEGYIGNPNLNHKIVGGVKDQNFFRIEGPGIGTGGSYASFACTNKPNCIQTDLFSLMGKIAVNNGLDIQQATYNRTSADGGSIDVFVHSETDQTIEVSGDGFVPTRLAGGGGQYYAHIPYTGAEPPAKVTFTNIDDKPPTAKTIALVDRISATANYNPEDKILTITAKSSDEIGPPTLSVRGFGNINPETGTLVIPDVSYLSPTITITSTNNGTVTIPVNIGLIPIDPDLVTPVTGADQSITVGSQESITLDGSKSTGPIQSYEWTQISGPVTDIEISDADKSISTFPTPETLGEYVFQLTVTGPNGILASKTTKIIILSPVDEPVANAGPDQTVPQGTDVTLDGSESENATAYSWKQTSGLTVTLNNADTVNPTFTFPKQPDPVVFELTVTGSDGKTATDTVEISTVPDNLTVTSADYRDRDFSWRIIGKSDVFGPDVIITINVVDSVNPDGTKLGTAIVNELGDWKINITRRDLTFRQGGTITIGSSSGGRLVNVPVEIRQ